MTLEEWESIAQQFEKATHYAEKALYKALSQNIMPTVTAELRVCFTFIPAGYTLLYLFPRRSRKSDGWRKLLCIASVPPELP